MAYTIKKLSTSDPELAEKLRAFVYDIVGCCQQVHKELGPYLNEYMYQDALEILFQEVQMSYVREYYFSVEFHGQRISHKHFVDFYCLDKVFIECKAIDSLGGEQRQQLWNYMRLTKCRLGILYNFAPVMAQCERYYFDPDSDTMYMF